MYRDRGDLISIAGQRETLAVDLDEVHLRMAVLNAEVYGVAAGVRALHADVRSVDLTGIDAVFVDPARRSGQRRLPTGHSEPPLAWCLSLAQPVPAVGIKLAPGLDRDWVPPGWELEFLAHGRDLKEAVAWSPALATAARRATILPGAYTLTPSDGAPVPVGPPGEFLLDPNPAVTRAGLVEELARITGCWKIDDQIAFLSADHLVRTAFARTLRVIESAPWKEKQLTARLRTGHRCCRRPPPGPRRRRGATTSSPEAAWHPARHPGHDPRARSAVGAHLRRCDRLTATGLCWFDHSL